MAPFDWDRVMAVDATNISDDDADQLYDMICKFNLGNDVGDIQLKQLFRVTQTIMSVKHEQSEDLMSEMEKQARETGKSGTRKEQDLLLKIDKLEDELKQSKRHGGDDAPMDSRVLREEIHDFEQQVIILQQELKDINRDLSDEKRATERYCGRIAEQDREMNELRRENDQLRQDNSDYKMQLQSQRENQSLRKVDDAEFRERLMKKNHELAEALEELQNLSDANEDLQTKYDQIKTRMEEAITEMDKTTEDNINIKAVLQQSDAVMDKLREDNEIMRTQVTDLTQQVSSKSDSDDEIMRAVNNKVEEWKAILQEKDTEIVEYQEQMFRMRDQLIATNMDSDRASVSALSKVVEEKDKQIELLSEQLTKVTADMETNAAIIDDLRTELNRGSDGPQDRAQQRLRDMLSTVKNTETRLAETEKRIYTAESDAKNKDKDLAEALERNRQYEQGEYGLAEAVGEIKECKTQIKVRDRQIEELTEHINKCEQKLNDFCEENEDLRDKLGIEYKTPLDLTEFRKSKNVKTEESRALNIILQKEIEQLEEERIELKQKLRKVAQKVGQRAVALGLSADDMLALQDYTDELRSHKNESRSSLFPDSQPSVSKISSAEKIRREVEDQELHLRNRELGQDINRNVKELEQVQGDVVRYKTRVDQLERENLDLVSGLRDVRDEMQNAQSPDRTTNGPVEISCPILDKLFTVMESRGVGGQYETPIYNRAQVDNLQGRNDELRDALKEARHDANKTQLLFDKMSEKVEKLEKDNEALREAGGGGGPIQMIALPEGMAASSSDVIASLNEHLLITLQELSLKEEMVEKMEAALENYKRKFAVMRHQQGLVYNDYITDKNVWETEKAEMKKKMRELEGVGVEKDIRIEEFDKLLVGLSADESSIKQRLAEMTRKLTVLRVNEKALTRRHQIMLEVEATLRKESERLKSEMQEMEVAASDRLSYLQRHKDTAVFKMAVLQRALDTSVPSKELEAANKEYHALTEKYRDLLEKGNALVEKTEAFLALDAEMECVKLEKDELKLALEAEKEKRHTLEAAMEDLQRRGIAGEAPLLNSDFISISKKITSLEMKEQNERQRAQHAVKMHDQRRMLMLDLEARNVELERNFAEVTKMNLEAQKVERDLRDELANSVTREVSDAERQKIHELEESMIKNKDEIDKLKEISDVASTQVWVLETQQVSREKELQSLRQQLVDFQMQSDEKSIIGKLHRLIVQLQVSEGTAIRKYDEAKKRITKREAKCLRLEQRLDEKDQTVYHNRVEAHNKAKHLQANLQYMRRQFAGAIPLERQEKFTKAMATLHQDKMATDKQLKDVQNEKNQVGDKLAELEVQHRSLQELLSTLRDSHGAQKVLEWHGKMDVLRLEELRLKRQNSRHQEHIKYLENVIRTHEVTIADLEADHVNSLKTLEVQQLRWEHREVELERTVSNLERQTAEIAGAASQFEEAIGRMPDTNLPMSSQLEQATKTIKCNVKLLLDTRSENNFFKQTVDGLKIELKRSETNVLGRDKLIAELRLRLPATSDRDDVIRRATENSITSLQAQQEMGEDYEVKKALKISQETISSLQARITTKEETIQKYQELLRQSRDDMQAMNAKHEAEVKVMQRKIHLNTDAAFSKFKDATREMLNKQPTSAIASVKQKERINELEETVSEQGNSLANFQLKINDKNREIAALKIKMQSLAQAFTAEKEKISDQFKSEANKHNSDIDAYEHDISQLRKEAAILNEEVLTLKDQNARAPTITMKNMVERLKGDLAVKDKQHQALTKALTELRTDMVAQAEETVRAQSDGQQVEANVQQLIDKKAKELQDKIDDLESQNSKVKRDQKKCKDSELSLQNDVDDLHTDVSRKERSITKLKGDKQRLEAEIEELERKVERISSNKTLRVDTDTRHKEVDEMRRRIQLLEEELRRKEQRAEKPFEKKEDMMKWEEGKKWQRTVEKMKVKIREKDEELSTLQRERDQLLLRTDKNSRERTGAEGKPTPAPREITRKPNHNLEEMKNDNFKLRDEVVQLKRQIDMGESVHVKQLDLRKTMLEKRVAQLERDLGQDTGGSQAYQDLSTSLQGLQKEMLKLSEENIELKFECEQVKRDAPRLQERLDDLQRYVEALKKENHDLSAGALSTRSSLPSTGSNIRRVGESGRSIHDLEKTVGLLKKVVEKLQTENEGLKKAPGVVSSDQLRLARKESDGLKSELDELKMKMGSELSERYTSQQKGTAKIVGDYEKLRKDYIKEMESNEKLRAQVKSLEIHRDQQIQKRAGRDEGRKGVPPGRVYEDMHRAVEDIDKRNKHISDLKTQLRTSSEQERDLTAEIKKLKQQLLVLQRHPVGPHTKDSDVLRDLQQARLTIDRMENEKKELIHELKLHQPHTSSEHYGEDIISRARAYDEAVRENVDTRMELKAACLDRDKLQVEVSKLTRELQNFGPEFFEEIEDLKYNYKQAVRKNVLYEEKLRQVSSQFGINVSLDPGSP